MQPDAIAAVPQITEEDLVASAPRVRHLLVSRLEAMWEPIRAALLRDQGAGDTLAPIDPRLLEIGLRIVKEEALLYRLQRPPVAAVDDEEEQVPGIDRRSQIEEHLMQIETRVKDNQSRA